MSKKIRRVPCKRVLPFKLATNDVVAAVKALSQSMKEQQALEQQMKDVTAHYREKLRAKKTEGEVLISRVRDEVEYRQVECEQRLDWSRGKVTVVRVDTGEVLEENDMTADERQVEMELMGAPGA